MTHNSRPRFFATSPYQFSFRVWWEVLGRVAAEADRRNLGLAAAGIAFYCLLSIFPLLAAIISIWGFVADPVLIRDQMELARGLVPDAAFTVVADQVSSLIAANDSTLQVTTILSILVAVWTTRNAVGSMIRGLNAAYREEHRANPLIRYVVAIALTVLLIAVALLAFASVVVVPIVFGYLALSRPMELAITAAKWAVLLSVVMFGIGLLYRYGPNRRGARLPWVTPGALFALVIWAAGSVALSVYFRNFSQFNELYGSLGAVVALLLWFYLSAYIVLLGAQLNGELELTTARDTTIGQERPGGSREAFVADNVVGSDGDIQTAAEINSTKRDSDQ